jgi:anti-sigma factor RsiW
MFARHPETLLIPHLRGELDAAARARIETHLRGCVRCRAKADGLSSALVTIRRQVAELPAPDWRSYNAELRRKIAARENRVSRWWRPTLIWTSFAATAVAAVALLTLFASQRGPNVDQIALVDVDVGLLRSYPVVEKMDLLENYDVIEHLDELNPPGADTNATRPL